MSVFILPFCPLGLPLLVFSVQLKVNNEKRILMSVPFLTEPAAECPTSPELLTARICSLEMENQEKEDLCVGSLPQQRTKNREPQTRVKPENEPQRLRPPD